MKNGILKFLAVSAVWLALVVCARAGDVYFSAAQNSDGSHLEAIGYPSEDNPTGEPLVGLAAPATACYVWFSNPASDTCVFVASVDTTVAKGTYNIGYFPYGGTVYVTIY